MGDYEGDEYGKEKNVVMFPFMAQGHMIPFMALALQIERQYPDYKVHIVNTPLNIANLRSSLPASSAVILQEIPFQSTDHGLPSGAENTDSLPYSLVDRLLWASLSLRPALAAILRRLRPICLIADIFYGWTTAVARDLGVFHAIFSGSGGFGLACYCSLWLSLPHRRLAGEAKSFSLADFPEAGKLELSQLPHNIAVADGRDAWSTFLAENFPAWSNSGGILFNTVGELDRVGLAYFESKFGVPVWPIGPVVLPKASVGKKSEPGAEACLEWLDSKAPDSVIYVSFGTMNTISAGQMVQLAMALEECEKSFLWVVRPPIGFDINSDFNAEQWLPAGFEGRVRERGLVVRHWAPQVDILAHAAVGAFLSHCGWNSALESLSNGVPMLGWPMAAEQFFNVVFLEREVGVCVEVARGKSCEVDHRGLAHKIQFVLGETQAASQMRSKACLVKQMIHAANQDSSSKALQDFFRCCSSA